MSPNTQVEKMKIMPTDHSRRKSNHRWLAESRETM